MRTVDWDRDLGRVRMIDQRLLPGEFKIVSYEDYQQVADAIKDMVVRGAPAIGAAAAYGLALAAIKSTTGHSDQLLGDLRSAAQVLHEARPTASNLDWALRRVIQAAEGSKSTADEIRTVVLSEAQRIADEDIEINKTMARLGAEVIDDGDTVIHHCNTGALAAVDWGTALGVIRMAHEQGKRIRVLVDETRPRLQGARLTAWELEQYGVPYDIISDNASGYFLHTGQVNKVLFGADRVVANGDVANKIGTYSISVLAKQHGIPFYVAAPISTIDYDCPDGTQIPIEERNRVEVTHILGNRIAPEVNVYNPAFDVTPNENVTSIITEKAVVSAPYTENLSKLVE